MTARAAFRQHDLARALRAARAADLPVARVEITIDKITIVAGEPSPAAAANPWDAEFKD